MRINEKQIQLIETTFRALGGKGHEFVEGFYQVLFKDSPEIEAMFSNTNWQQQRSKLMLSLIMTVDNLHDMEHIKTMFQETMKAHNPYPILDEHYHLMTDAMLITFADVLGENWSAEAEIAWRIALDEITSILQGKS